MLTIISILVPVAVGAAAMWLAPRFEFRTSRGVLCEINRLEFAVTTFVVVLVSVLVTVVWGPSAARAQAAGGYREFLNGSVISSSTGTNRCSRDGACTHEYRCDPYQVEDRHYDSKGNYAYSTYHTEYHHCPYATRETSYFLHDTLGRTLPIGTHYLDADPVAWRGGHDIPGNLPRGEPPRWTEAVEHLHDGTGDPVTQVHHYTNFILPTEGELYKQYNGSVDRYLKAKLLPKHTAHLGDDVLYDFEMTAQKFQSMGVKVDTAQWNARLMQLNAAVGVGVRGDIHVVVVPADRVRNPDDYMNALVSYWQHKLGRWGFPKNGIAVVLGASADGKSVVWARAKTGMPEGNGEMLAAVSLELPDKPLDPDAILGDVTARVTDAKKVDYGDSADPDGALGEIILSEHPFQRACMRCKDADDKGTGYVYLKDSLPVSAGAKVLMFFVVLFISLLLFGAALYFDPVAYFTGNHNPTRY